MPGPPFTERFDQAAASAAIIALRAAASTIGATTEARVRVAAEAQRDWVGRTRARFDEELRGHVRAASDLAAACLAAAAAIEASAEDARAEQRRRALARAGGHDDATGRGSAGAAPLARPWMRHPMPR